MTFDRERILEMALVFTGIALVLVILMIEFL